MIENIFIWPRQEGWKRTFLLVLSVALGGVLGYLGFHYLPIPGSSWWWLVGLIITFIIQAIIISHIHESEYWWILVGTISGMIWCFVAAAYIMARLTI